MNTKGSLRLKYEPRPPKKRKREIYDPAKYKKLNKRIENMPPKFLNTDVKDLVKYLTESCADDLAKVHALFYWVTSRSFFATTQGNARKYSACWYLNKILTGYGNFAHFFYILCWHADISCVIIGGVTKNSGYKLGLPIVTPDMTAQWNAVYVEGDWHLASVQWACIYASEPNDWKRVVAVSEREFFSSQNIPPDHGNDYNVSSLPKKPKTKHEYFYHANDYYFLTDPDELIWTHFPNRKQWQLLDNPVTLEEFLGHFYVREQFYHLGMSLTKKSHTDCVLLVDKCRMVQIEFALPPERNATYRFKYTIARHWSSDLSNKGHNFLQMGKYELKDDRLLLTLHFKSKGTYKLDIFGCEKQTCDFYLICSYVVKCAYTEEGPALPWKFFLGYGCGFNPLEKKLATNNGRIKLPFPMERKAILGHELSHSGKLLEGYSLLRMHDGDDDDDDNDDNGSDLVTMIIELRLPEPGKYGLSVYQMKHAERKVLCNYSIIYEKDTRTSLPMIQGPIIKHKTIAVLSHPGSFIQTHLDNLNVLFRSEYQLSCRLISPDPTSRTNAKSSALHDTATKGYEFSIGIPNYGDYTLKIFAKFSERTAYGQSDGQLCEVHSYRVRRLNPDQFFSRWIGTDRLTSAYIVGTFETCKSTIKICQTDFKNEMLLIVQYQNEATPCNNLVSVFDEEDKSYIQVTLPHLGDYLLSLLEKDSITGLVRKVTRYLLRRKQNIEKINGDRDNNIQREMREKCEKSGKELEQKTDEFNIKDKMAADNYEAEVPKSTTCDENFIVSNTVNLANFDETISETKVAMTDFKHNGNKQETLYEKHFNEIKNTECSDSSLMKENEHDISECDNNELLKLSINHCEKPAKRNNWNRTNKSFQVSSDKKDSIKAQEVEEHQYLAVTSNEGRTKVASDEKLYEKTSQAKKLSNVTNELDDIRTTIGSFDHRAISEIKSYSNPPKGVTVVMRSVFLVLNVSEDELKDWKQILILMRSIKYPFIRRILNCSPQCVSSKSVKAAEANLGMLRVEDMSCVSEMAMVLLTWVKKIIEETKKHKLNINLGNSQT